MQGGAAARMPGCVWKSVRRQPVGVCSLLQPHKFRGSNSGMEAEGPAPSGDQTQVVKLRGQHHYPQSPLAGHTTLVLEEREVTGTC